MEAQQNYHSSTVSRSCYHDIVAADDIDFVVGHLESRHYYYVLAVDIDTADDNLVVDAFVAEIDLVAAVGT